VSPWQEELDKVLRLVVVLLGTDVEAIVVLLDKAQDGDQRDFGGVEWDDEEGEDL
jgi:hypothetical protein